MSDERGARRKGRRRTERLKSLPLLVISPGLHRPPPHRGYDWGEVDVIAWAAMIAAARPWAPPRGAVGRRQT